MGRLNMKKVTNVVFVVICTLIVCVPVLFFNWKPDQISTAENRQLAELSSPKDGISTFMKSVDSYVNDRIGFRDQAVQLYRQATIKYLNYRHDQVLIGDDGWLYYYQELADYTGTNNSNEAVDRYIAILKKIDTWCKERDIQFVFAVGPNKSTIYSEYMPSYVKQADVTLLDTLMEKAEQEDLLFICPKQELLDYKDEQELYMRLDTHWNPLGSRYMLNQLTESLEIVPIDVSISPTYTSVGDLKDMLAIGDTGVISVTADVPLAAGASVEKIPDTKHLFIHSENKENFVCYRDSFSIALVEYYTHYFNGPMYWSFTIDFDYVERIKPKYLILECVERYLSTAIESNAIVLDWKSE